MVNNIGSITERISEYVDEKIKSLAKLVASCIKDTTHFLPLLKNINIERKGYLNHQGCLYTKYYL